MKPLSLIRWSFIFAALLLVGCDRLPQFSSAAESSPADDAEEKASQVTLWGERFEIFLEHAYIVANTPVEFITHATNLQTLQPRSEGPMTFILRKGTDPPIEHTEPEPARDGIYIPTLTFPSAGQWNVSLMVPVDGGDHVIDLPPFTVYATAEDVDNAPDPEHLDGISFLKEQQWKIPTKTEPAVRRNVVERLHLIGNVTAPPNRIADVSPVVAGILLAPADRDFYTIGDRVEAGDVLMRIQPPLAGSDFLTFLSNINQLKIFEVDMRAKKAEAEARLTEARMAVPYARKVFERISELRQKNAKSERELEEAQQELLVAEAKMAAAQTLINAYHEAQQDLAAGLPAFDFESGFPVVELKAPISGVITQINAIVGEYVLPEQPVFSILDPSTVYIEAKVPETDLAKMGASHAAVYVTPAAPDRYLPMLGEGGGRLVYLGREVDKKTRTVPLVYEVSNLQGHLPIGMALDIYVESAQVPDALVVPESALVEEAGRANIFVMLAGETFERRQIQLGIRDAGFVQVLAGLAEGEQVVTLGAYAVRLASVGSSVPTHGHVH